MSHLTYIPSNIHDRCCFSGNVAQGYAQVASDHNCCTVNAFAAAFNVVWSEARAALAKMGRKNRHGFTTWVIFGDRYKPITSKYGEAREAKWLYKTGAKYGRAGMTLGTFLKRCDPSKRYLLTIARHALAVVDGKLRDQNDSRLGCRIRYIWEVTPILHRPGAINLPAIVNKNLTTPVSCEKVLA
jgi:hypothetical protein